MGSRVRQRPGCLACTCIFSFSGHLILVTSLWERCSLAYARFKEGNGGPKRLSLLKIQSLYKWWTFEIQTRVFLAQKISDLYHEKSPLPRSSICVGRLFFWRRKQCLGTDAELWTVRDSATAVGREYDKTVSFCPGLDWPARRCWCGHACLSQGTTRPPLRVLNLYSSSLLCCSYVVLKNVFWNVPNIP